MYWGLKAPSALRDHFLVAWHYTLCTRSIYHLYIPNGLHQKPFTCRVNPSLRLPKHRPSMVVTNPFFSPTWPLFYEEQFYSTLDYFCPVKWNKRIGFIESSKFKSKMLCWCFIMSGIYTPAQSCNWRAVVLHFFTGGD